MTCQVLFNDSRTEIIRVQRQNGPVILKTVHPDLSSRDKKLIENEFQILQSLQSSHVIKAVSLEGNTLVLEDFEGTPLTTFIVSDVDIKVLLKIAIELAEGLGEIHHSHIIHKDIKPTNILINSKTHQIKYIDFGISSLLPREVQHVLNLTEIEGTLCYISPEQTGRMNRPLDYRTDIYSLGVTLYQIFTKKLPFEAKELKDIIHMHIATHPIPPKEANPNLPEMISDIIMKCLAKDADARYQSAFGLKKDLENCLQQLENTNQIKSFKPGENDLYDQFKLPNKLYGREEEIKLLFDCFQKMTEGNSQVLFVKGYAGIGKTSLVNELQRLVVNKNGLFVSGKFDQFKQNASYSGLVRILQALTEQLYLEPESDLRKWKEKILETIDQNGQVLLDIFPEMENLIGKQPALPPLGPQEAENRLNYVVTSFLNIFIASGHPLVIFMDDLQWADEYTLKFLEFLIRSNQPFFFIGSYRDNEVSAIHPLTFTLENLKEASVPIQILQVKPLGVPAVQELINAAFHGASQANLDLSNLIHHKTHGNPFFIGQFLKFLYQKELFDFDPKTQSWIAKLSEIEKVKVTENVADLIGQKLKLLEPETQNLLKISSVIGQTFDLSDSADLTNIPFSEAVMFIQQALKEEFIFHGIAENVYTFGHDRIQQTCYQMIDEKDKASHHYRIAQRLLKKSDKQKLHESVIEIANHFNEGRQFIKDPAEIEEAIRLNIIAGEKMKETGAFLSAKSYFEIGKELLPPNPWKDHYALSFALESNLAQCEQLVGDVAKANEIFKTVIREARSSDEKIQTYVMQIVLYNQQKLFTEAIESGIKALELLNFSIPRYPGKLRLLFELIKTKCLMYFISFEDIKNLPKLNNPRIDAISSILSSMNGPTLVSGRYLLCALTNLKGVQLTLKHGISLYGLFWMAAYFATFEQVKRHKDFKALLGLLKDYPQNLTSMDITFAFYFYSNRWGDTYKSCVKELKNMTHKFFEMRHIQLSTTTIAVAAFYMLLGGERLENIINYLETATHEFQNYTSSGLINALSLLELSRILKGTVRDTLVPRPRKIHPDFLKDDIATYSISLGHIAVLYYFNHFEEASVITLKMQSSKLHPMLKSIPTSNLLFFYGAMSLCAMCIKHNVKSNMREIKEFHKQLKKWSDVSPNCLPQYYLISAEIAQIENKHDESIDLYQKAIDAAKSMGFIHEEALANERLALLYIVKGNEDQAKKFLQNALKKYSEWGAQPKIQSLEQTHYHLLEKSFSGETISLSSTSTPTANSVTFTTQSLDVETMIIASQSISKEIFLEDLIKKLMQTILVNAGADKVFLFLLAEGKLKIKAKVSLQQKEIELFNNLPLESLDNEYCLPAVHYVERAQSILVLNNACEQGLLSSNDYIRSQNIQSLAVVPLLQQNKLIGVIYLENSLSKGVFTESRLQLLTILSSQVAISLENARFFERMNYLYKSTERFVPKYFLNLINKKNIEEINLGDGVEREVSVLFTDLRNFTSLVQKRTPKEAFRIINQYLEFIAPIIRKHRGFINQFLGDGILALFPEDPEDAINAGLALLDILKEFNLQQSKVAGVELEMGIGLNTGKAMLGIIGEKERLEPTVVSDVANAAARIESLNKTYKTHFLISDETHKKIQSIDKYVLRRIDRVYLMGRDTPTNIFEVIDWIDKVPHLDKNRYLETFALAFETYEKGDFVHSLKLFAECESLFPHDPVLEILKKRCELFIKIPPENWNGTFLLTHK